MLPELAEALLSVQGDEVNTANATCTSALSDKRSRCRLQQVRDYLWNRTFQLHTQANIEERDVVCQKVIFSQQTWSGQLPKISCGIESSRVFDCLDFGSSMARQSANFGRIWLPNSTDFEPFLFRLDFGSISARFGSFWLVLARCSRASRAKSSQNRAEIEPKFSRN